MYRLIDVQGIPCTKGAAVSHATLAGIPGEREIKPTRMKFLRGLVENGLFGAPTWARGRCKEDGVMYRLDGQHSSTMLSEFENDDMPADLMIQMATWEFDTLAEAADLFNMFNNPRSVRSNEDVMGVYTAVHPELAHFTRKFLVAVSNGVHIRETDKYDAGDETALGPFTPRERGLYFSEPGPRAVANWLARFKGMKNGFFLNQPLIVAEMIAEWEANESLATAFWTIVFTEDGPNGEPVLASHPAKVLAEIYRDNMRAAKGRPPQWKAKAAKAWKQFQIASEREPVTA